MKQIGVVIEDHGAAIVTLESTITLDIAPPHTLADFLSLPEATAWPEWMRVVDDLVVAAIERLPFDLAAVTDRVMELDEPETRFIIDGEGLGSALWTVAGGPENVQHWHLYSGRGLERQALVDALLVAIQEGRFHFAPGLTEQPAMSKAMVSYRRQVKEDGYIGSELVVALLLAVHNPVTVAEGWFTYA